MLNVLVVPSLSSLCCGVPAGQVQAAASFLEQRSISVSLYADHNALRCRCQNLQQSSGSDDLCIEWMSLTLVLARFSKCSISPHFTPASNVHVHGVQDLDHGLHINACRVLLFYLERCWVRDLATGGSHALPAQVNRAAKLLLWLLKCPM